MTELANVEVRSTGKLMRTKVITGKRSELLTAGKVLQRNIGALISKV